MVHAKMDVIVVVCLAFIASPFFHSSTDYLKVAKWIE
jgi:hypothetical protein